MKRITLRRHNKLMIYNSTFFVKAKFSGTSHALSMLGDLATPLRSGSAFGGAGCDVELAGTHHGTPRTEGPRAQPSRRSQIHIIAQPCKERLLGLLLAVALIVPTVTVVTVVAAEWVSSPSQRGWLILGFGFYIMTAMRSLWGYFIQVYEGMFHPPQGRITPACLPHSFRRSY